MAGSVRAEYSCCHLMRLPMTYGQKLIMSAHFEEGDFGLVGVHAAQPFDDGGGFDAGPYSADFLPYGTGDEVVGLNAQEKGSAGGLFLDLGHRLFLNENLLGS